MILLSFILFSYWMSFWIAAYPDGALRVLEDGKDRSLKLPLEPWRKSPRCCPKSVLSVHCAYWAAV